MGSRHKSSKPARARARARSETARLHLAEPRVYTFGDMRTAPRGAFMLCKGACGGQFSATRGDYWQVPDEVQIKCCGVPAVLAVEKRRIVLV